MNQYQTCHHTTPNIETLKRISALRGGGYYNFVDVMNFSFKDNHEFPKT